MVRDIRYALRTLRSAPAFAITVVLTLGIGLGLNIALFTLFNAYVLHPFAVKDPYSLYRFGWKTTQAARQGVTWEQYREIRSDVPVFSDSLAFSPFLARVEARNLEGMAVSGNYFTMLGVGATLGRPILPEDAATPGMGAVVILSNQIWKAAFAGDPGIVGRTIRIGGKPFEVIGIGPPAFSGIAELPIDFYIPLTMQSAVVPGPDLFGPDKPRGVMIVGRVRRDIPVEKARAALTVWIKHATEKLPENERALQATLESQATPVSADPEDLVIFLPLIVVFGLVLVICCANVSNMMLARALARQREIGVRLAMGAQRSRLIRQLLSESVLLSLMAATVGFGVSISAIRGAVRVLTSTLPGSIASLLHIAPIDADYRVFLFILFAAGLSTVLFGLAPALQATRTSLMEVMRGEFGGRASSSRLRSVLVVSQISVCVILLVLTGILLRGSSAYQHKDLGYNIHGIVYPLFLGRGADVTDFPKVAQKLSTDAWVEQWAATWRAPLESIAEIPTKNADGTQSVHAGYNLVSPEYFKVLDIPILRGRNFSQVEAESEAPVVIVSQATAQKFWPNENALGKTLMIDRKASRYDNLPRTDQAVIVGIAKDVTSGILINGTDSTMMYFPTHVDAKRRLMFLIRGKGTVSSATRRLEGVLDATVPNRPAVALSLDEMFQTQAYPFWAATWIAAMLGGLALLLTLSGMYGVLSYLVGQRTKEIGIRMALGATPGIVVRLILNQSLRFAIWGTAVGLALAFGGALLLRHLLTMINAFDVVSYGSGAAIVALASLAAAFFPSSRAARINPVETLRAE
jgi:predicted permease